MKQLIVLILVMGFTASCDAQRKVRKELEETVLLADETFYYGYGNDAPFKIVTTNDSIAKDFMECKMWYRGYMSCKSDRKGPYMEYTFYFPVSYYYALDIYFIKKQKLPHE